MKKPYKHSDLSNKKCVVCGQRLKLNLVSRQPKAKYCFKHWLQLLGRRQKDNQFNNYQHEH